MTAQLTDAQLRALRILADHDEVEEGSRTREAGTLGHIPVRPKIHPRTARALGDKWLAESHRHDGVSVYWTWSIRAKGRQVLRAVEAGEGA